MNDRAPTILVLGGRLQSDGYPRNRELLEAMTDAGWELRWCALSYPPSFHRLALPLRLAFIAVFTPPRWLFALVIAVFQRLRSPVSHVYVPFPGLLDLPVAWLVAHLCRARLVADIFLGVYNTLVQDRRLLDASSPVARALYRLERFLLGLPDVGLIDTDEHRQLLQTLFDTPAIRLAVVPIAVDESLHTFAPPGDADKVIFWGTYIKLHGVETIARAASLVQRANPGIRFEMIGIGQELPRAKQLAAELNVSNIDFVEDILPMEEVIERARSAFAALGIFGQTKKSVSIFPYKAVQALALGCPLVTSETPAASRVLRHERDALLVPPGDADALAQALMRLHDDRELRVLLSRRGRAAFDRSFSRRRIRTALDEVFLGRAP